MSDRNMFDLFDLLKSYYINGHYLSTPEKMLSSSKCTTYMNKFF